MTCHYCGAATVNGLALCSMCQLKATRIFDYLPVYFRNLARWRPGRTGSRQVPGSRVLYDGTTIDGRGDRITDALDEAYIALMTYADKVAQARPFLARLLERLLTARREERLDNTHAVAWLCAGLQRHLTTVATLDWCGDFLREIHRHEVRLRTLTETAIPGWYAGACKQCGADTHVVPGLTWVTCLGIVDVQVDDEGHRHAVLCGATTYARDHLDIVLAEARDWVAPPKRIAEALVALVDTEQSVPRLHKRIAKWGERDKLHALDSLGYQRELDYAGEKYAPRRYRFGDVLDLLRAEGQTRLGVSSSGAAS